MTRVQTLHAEGGLRWQGMEVWTHEVEQALIRKHFSALFPRLATSPTCKLPRDIPNPCRLGRSDPLVCASAACFIPYGRSADIGMESEFVPFQLGGRLECFGFRETGRREVALQYRVRASAWACVIAPIASR